jgi:MoxR-like ATPase
MAKEGGRDIAGIAAKVCANIEKVIVGKRHQIGLALTAYLAEGHILLEDVPGVAKTMLARAIARSVGCVFKRVQCTPDLLPSDVTGTSIYRQDAGTFEFRQGPIFANVVLADEINRTTPRTQSAMLEAMSDGTVSAEGHVYHLPQPFLVVATQNPYEFEGTYFLPENQLDRFLMRLSLGYPSPDDEARILLKQPARSTLPELKPAMGAEEVLELPRRTRALLPHVSLSVTVPHTLPLHQHRRHVLRARRTTEASSDRDAKPGDGGVVNAVSRVHLVGAVRAVCDREAREREARARRRTRTAQRRGDGAGRQLG